MALRFSKQLFTLHSRLGVAVGLVLMLIGIAGAALVWNEEIDAALYPVPVIANPPGVQLPLSEILRGVQTVYPKAGVNAVWLHPDVVNSAMTVNIMHEGNLWQLVVNPFTAEILSARNLDASFVKQLLAFHRSFFSRPWGESIVGLCAIAMFLSAMTGLIVYRNSLLRVFQKVVLRRGTAKYVFADVHRFVGVCVSLFLLVASASGFYMTYPAYGKLFSSSVRKERTAKLDYAFPYDSLLARARAHMPGLQPRVMMLPRGAAQPIKFAGSVEGESVIYGGTSSSVSFNPETGAVVEAVDIGQASIAVQTDKIIRGIHFGQYGGWPLKIVYTLCGCMPGLLAITGLVLWRKRGRKNTSEPMDVTSND